MGYTNKNMATTLELAKKYLKAGFIKGRWICRSNKCKVGFVGPGGARCCAEGAVILATDPMANDIGAGHSPGYTNYQRHLVDMLSSNVRAGSRGRYDNVMAANDAKNSNYKKVAKYFDMTIKQLES